ncbi:CPBP family intramembrane metalloprotease [Candidatus Micrarchaeota archaeon]|nr:CPBP family intramembrane metalloprotease [Candidatus Micrarchaeota archaeon]
MVDFGTYAGSGAIHMCLLSLSMFFLWKKDWRTTFESIGVPGRLRNGIFYGFMTLSAIFLVLFALGIFAILLGFNDQQKVDDKINSLPALLLVFAVVGAPVTEELFFRGFLAQRYGILLSAAFFGLMHFAYGSTVEVLGAFVIGIVLAASFKLTKSVTPCIIAHMVYNAISITFMRLFS